MKQGNLFSTPARNPQPPYYQGRLNRHQLLDDRAFYEDLLRVVYEAGPNGISMRRLINMGVKRRWWQDTASKHFGEKMRRAAWTFGLLVVNEAPGSSTGTAQKRVVHPAFSRSHFKAYILNGAGPN